MKTHLICAYLCALAIPAIATLSKVDTRWERASILATKYNLIADSRAYVSGPTCKDPRRELSQIIRVGEQYTIWKSENENRGWEELGKIELPSFNSQLAFVYALCSVVFLSAVGDSTVGVFFSQLFAFALTSFAVGLDHPATVDNHSTYVIIYLILVVFGVLSFKPTWWTTVVWISFVYFLKMFYDVFPQFVQLAEFARVMQEASDWACGTYVNFVLGFAFTVILRYLRTGIFVVIVTWAAITALVLNGESNLAYFVGTVVSVASLLSLVRYDPKKETDEEPVTESGAKTTQPSAEDKEEKEAVSTRAPAPVKEASPPPVPKAPAAPSVQQHQQHHQSRAQQGNALETFEKVRPQPPVVHAEPQRSAQPKRTTSTKAAPVARNETTIQIDEQATFQTQSVPVNEQSRSGSMDLDKKGQKRQRVEEGDEPVKYQKL